MESPELRRTPQQQNIPNPIPFHLGNALPANQLLGDDPFVAVNVDGNRYTLTPEIVAQLANILPMAQPVRNYQNNATAGPSRLPANVSL